MNKSSNPKELELPLPPDITEMDLHAFLRAMPVSCPPFSKDALVDYCDQHIRRFIYTYGLIKDLEGKALELGAGPYFFTLLMNQFTDLDLVLANYYGPSYKDDYVAQHISYLDFYTGDMRSTKLDYHHFDVERERFPFEDAEFDVVLFCEIIEHLTMDPVFVLKEIKRILKPKGKLILTTPNVNRLENIYKIVLGDNIYDPYSGFHGPYGRHNREYNVYELYLLLDYCGFSIDNIFTLDVQNVNIGDHNSIGLSDALKNNHALGQYIFISALNSGDAPEKRPTFLYRSYPQGELDNIEIHFPERDDIIAEPIVVLGKCWYGVELWNSIPTRWMGKEAVLFVYSADDQNCDLTFRSLSFKCPRNLEITKDGISVAQFCIPTTFSEMKTPIKLKVGFNLIKFRSLENCGRASDYDPENADDRCLSFAFQNIKIS